MKVFISFFILLCIGIILCFPVAAQKTISNKRLYSPLKNIQPAPVKPVSNNSSLNSNSTTDDVCDALGMYNKDTSICLGTTFALHARPANDYVWSPADGLSSTTDQSTIVTTDVTRTYKLVSRIFSGNLVRNGDFSAGDVDFSSKYLPCTSSGCLLVEGRYAIGIDPRFYQDAFVGKDHTTGKGNFMIVNGSDNQNTIVWQQEIDVKPNTDYNFSTWVSSVKDGNPASLQFQINGQTQGAIFNAPSSTNDWERFFINWNSGGNVKATITILNQNTVANGNDFGLDDIFFQELTPCPAQITVTVLKKPEVSIKASPTAICQGSPITFTATAKDEGSSAIYQWKINGITVGTNSSTFTTNALRDGDRISTTVTNSCGIAESNEITITVASKLSPSIAIKSSSTDICDGTPVTFTASLTNEGSAPQIQWNKNGQPVGTNSSTYIDNNIADNDVISASLTSNAGCLVSPLAESNIIKIKVVAKKTPTIIITSSGTSICAGTPVTFTSVATVAGTAPIYQWQKNGAPVGTNSTSYTDNTLADNDVITAILISNETCVTTNTATSNPIKIKVVSNLIPSISISASATTICPGTAVTFTAAANGGSTPEYQWKKNEVAVGTNTATYIDNDLKSGDAISCTLISNDPCVVAKVTESNVIVMKLIDKLSPTISIKATATDVCAGNPVTFTASVTNEGSAPQIQWKKNGTVVGTNSLTYTDNDLKDGDLISASLTSNAGCLLSPLAESNLIPIKVTIKRTPTITITSSGTSICSGTPVTFTALATVTGAAPIYQWQKNGTPVGTNTTTYTDNDLKDGDVITAGLSSNETCVTTATAASNPIKIKVVSNLTPSITITASATTICPGSPVTFTAAANGGSAPEYQWKKNGQPVGTNTTTYTDNDLKDGDAISCTLIANDPCVVAKVSESNVVVMKLIDKLTPSITISPSTNDICIGTPVTFSAVVMNEGSNPVFQWKKNGTIVGNNSATYSDNTLADGDIITATLTSNAACLVGPTATSNNIIMKVMAKRIPAITITASGTSICVGTPVTFTAVPLYQGTAPVYEWKKNGTIVGANATTYTDNNLVDGDVVTANLISNETCIATTTAASNPIKITVVSNLVPSISIKASATSICPGSPVTFTATANGGSAAVFQWEKNGINVGTNAVTYVDDELKDGDVISCVLVANDPCVVNKETTSNSITIKLVDKVTPTISITAPVTAICPGTPVTFKAAITNAGVAPIYHWKKNGDDVGSNTNVYTDYKLADGDEVMCILISNDFCVVGAAAESNRIKIDVNNSVLRPIDLGKDTLICSVGGLLLNAKAGYLNYKWQDGTSDSTYRVTKSGTYFVEAFDGCKNKYNDTIQVVFDQPIPFDLGVDKTICIGDSVTITGSPGFASYTWYPQQNIVGADKQTATLFPITSSTYTAYARKASGCTVIDSVHINVNIPAPLNLGADTSLCKGDSLILNGGNGYATYTWSTGSNKPIIIVKNKGAYILKVRDGNGCLAMDTLNVLNVFNLPVVRLNKDSILCTDSSKILDAGNGFKNYNWNNGQHTQNILVDTIGIYKVQVTDINGCSASDDSKITRIIPTPKDFLPQDTAICSFDSIMLRSAISYSDYVWSSGQTTRSITVKNPGNYLLQVRDEFGCAGTDSVLINPKECALGFFIPTAFTPNGDGKNDLFFPIMNGVVKEYSFSVFNRWGEVVFSSEKVGEGWNGKERGRPQTTNVFIWTCRYRFEGGGKEFQKGSVVLIK